MSPIEWRAGSHRLAGCAAGGRPTAAAGIVKLLLPDLSERLDDGPSREAVTGLLRLLETEPSVLGLSQNLVAIARVPG